MTRKPYLPDLGGVELVGDVIVSVRADQSLLLPPLAVGGGRGRGGHVAQRASRQDGRRGRG